VRLAVTVTGQTVRQQYCSACGSDSDRADRQQYCSGCGYDSNRVESETAVL